MTAYAYVLFTIVQTGIFSLKTIDFEGDTKKPNSAKCNEGKNWPSVAGKVLRHFFYKCVFCMSVDVCTNVRIEI